MGIDGEESSAMGEIGATLHYSAPRVTLADVVLDVVRKLPGPPDALFCERVAERAGMASLPRPQFEDVYTALTALVETGRIHVQRLAPGCTRPPCADPTAPEARPTPEIPPPPQGVEVWRGTAPLWFCGGRDMLVAVTKTDHGHVPWFADGIAPGWSALVPDETTRSIFAAWALSAEGRAAHATSRAALLDVQREDAVHLAERRATERDVVREVAARAHYALHEADVMLFALRGLHGIELAVADAGVDATVRTINGAHGTLHEAGIAAVEPVAASEGADPSAGATAFHVVFRIDVEDGAGLDLATLRERLATTRTWASYEQTAGESLGQVVFGDGCDDAGTRGRVSLHVVHPVTGTAAPSATVSPGPDGARVSTVAATVAWLRNEAATYGAIAAGHPKGQEKTAATAFATTCTCLADDLEAGADAGNGVPVNPEMPRRFRVRGVRSTAPVPTVLGGVYFPRTDLCITDLGRRGTGIPTGDDIVWIDPEPKR